MSLETRIIAFVQSVGADIKALFADKANLASPMFTNAGDNPALAITNTGAGNCLVVNDGDADSSPFTITSDGTVLIGTNTKLTDYLGYEYPATLQIASNKSTAPNANVAYKRSTNDGVGSISSYLKTRGTLAAPITVISGDEVGRFSFSAYTGATHNAVAKISVQVDGVPSLTSSPGRIAFFTTPADSVVSTERLRIDSAGQIVMYSGLLGPSSAQQHTLPAVASDTFTLNNAAQTLINKTLTAPVIDTPNGTAPFSVASTTLVANLNADLLDGNHASAFATASHTHSYQAADGDLLAIGGLTGTSGLLRKTAVDTWTLDTATYATGTGTASGTNTGDQTIPTTLPASDVYTWAKEATKPAYTAAEVGLGNVNNTSDAGKPISTAQAAELALKASLTGVETLANKSIATESLPVITNNLPATLPTLSLDFANSRTVDPRITFTRASTATRTNDKGLLETVPAGVPRIDFDPVTLECKGLLIEGSRTNLLLNSTIDGANLATQTVTTYAVSQVLTFYGTGTVALSGAYTGALVGSGAYPTRSKLVFTPTDGSLTLTATGTVQFANLEVGASNAAVTFETSYIQTNAAAVTRAAETAVMSGANFSSWFNASEGAFVVDGAAPQSAANPAFMSADASSTLYRFTLFRASTTGKSQFYLRNAGTGDTALNSAIDIGAGFVKIAAAYKVGSAAMSVNGSAPVTGAPSALATPDRLTLGSYGATFASPLNGHIKRLSYYPQRLTSAQLQALSTQ